MSKLEFYCTEFDLFTSDQEVSDFDKVPEPRLSEVQDVQFTSFFKLQGNFELLNSSNNIFITFKVSSCRIQYKYLFIIFIYKYYL